MLNIYLNDMCNYLLNNDSFLLNNIDIINKLSILLNNLNISNNNSITNSLTHIDIINIVEDFIITINPFYIIYYYRLIESGILNFDYENNSKNYFHHTKYHNEININRSFNYNDVISLIHEFIHYMSGNKIKTYNRSILKEFLAIYFELKGYDFLYNLNIPNNEINYNKRIINLDKCIKEYLKYNIPLTMFIKNYYIINNDLLDYFKTKEYEYNSMYFNEERSKIGLSKYISSIFINQYRYILGTSLAFYAYLYSDIKDIINLNNNINNNINNYSHLTINEILNIIGINIEEDYFYNGVLNGIKVYQNKIIT